jgi:hypothetical protein
VKSERGLAMITKAKKKKTSRILEAVHETARDLQAAGLISERRIQDYDALKGEDGHGQARTVTDVKGRMASWRSG